MITMIPPIIIRIDKENPAFLIRLASMAYWLIAALEF
jgi:hypothetical protein